MKPHEGCCNFCHDPLQGLTTRYRGLNICQRDLRREELHEFKKALRQDLTFITDSLNSQGITFTCQGNNLDIKIDIDVRKEKPAEDELVRAKAVLKSKKLWFFQSEDLR